MAASWNWLKNSVLPPRHELAESVVGATGGAPGDGARGGVDGGFTAESGQTVTESVSDATVHGQAPPVSAVPSNAFWEVSPH